MQSEQTYPNHVEPTGAPFLKDQQPHEDHSYQAQQPRWDDERGILYFGEHVIKRFRRPAPSQRLILAAFQEEAWPHRIDDPLPPVPGKSESAIKWRLRSIVGDLNRAQHGSVRIHFGLNGFGNGVRWMVDIE